MAHEHLWSTWGPSGFICFVSSHLSHRYCDYSHIKIFSLAWEICVCPCIFSAILFYIFWNFSFHSLSQDFCWWLKSYLTHFLVLTVVAFNLRHMLVSMYLYWVHNIFILISSLNKNKNISMLSFLWSLWSLCPNIHFILLLYSFPLEFIIGYWV